MQSSANVTKTKTKTKTKQNNVFLISISPPHFTVHPISNILFFLLLHSKQYK